MHIWKGYMCVLCYDIYSVVRRWIVTHTHKRWTRYTQVLMWTFCGGRRNSWILIRRTLVGTIDPRQKKTWEIHPQDGERFTKDFCGFVGVQYCEQIARCHFWLSHSRYGNRTSFAHDHSKCRKTIHKKICGNLSNYMSKKQAKPQVKKQPPTRGTST